MPAMTVAPDPGLIFNIVNWFLWGTLGTSAAVMVVMLVAASGCRYLREKVRSDPGPNVKAPQ